MFRAIRGISAITLTLVAAVVLFSVAFLLLPIHLGAGTQSRGEFLAPLLAAAALLVSGVVLTASVRTAGASYRAEERVKEDIAILLTALRNIRLRLRLCGPLDLKEGGRPLDLVTQERRVIDSINNSTTGYALIVFEAQRSRLAGGEPSEWRVLQIYLLETLAANKPGIVLARALALEKLLETLTARDIRRLAGYVSDLGTSTTLFRSAYGVLDAIDKEPSDSDERIKLVDNSSTDTMLAKFRQIKARGVDDPDVDMFIAVLEGDGSVDTLKDALARGADPNITDTQVLRRYE